MRREEWRNISYRTEDFHQRRCGTINELLTFFFSASQVPVVALEENTYIPQAATTVIGDLEAA